MELKAPETGKDILITYADMDSKMVLKPSALFNYLQELASENAEEYNFGFSATYPNNLGWFLLKYRMEFTSYPKNLKNIYIKTTPRGCYKLFAYRNFTIYNDNSVIGRISSTWSLVDLTSKKLMIVDKALSSPYLVKHEKTNEDLNYEKIPEIDTADLTKEFEIRFDDIDVNGHVNNANYIIWALEPLDFYFRCKKHLKTLDVVFKKEVKYGNKILSEVKFDGTKTIHLLKNSTTGEDLCAIQAEWIDN